LTILEHSIILESKEARRSMNKTKKKMTYCLTCRQSFDLALTQTCPYCGQQADEHGIPVLYQAKTPGHRGGKRQGAGAPRGNLNRLKHGRRSKLIERGVEKICQDPDLLAILYLISALAESDSLPPQTKEVVLHIINRSKKGR
jgi:hypothetical protein